LPILHELSQITAQRELHEKRPTAKSEDGEIVARQDEVCTAAAEHGLGDVLGDGLGRQLVLREAVAGVEALEQRRVGVALAHEHRPHLGCFVQAHELSRQTFVEGNCRCFRRCVVDHAWSRHECRQRCHRHHHTVVLLDHVWQELLRQEVVCLAVDVKSQRDVGLSGVQDASTTHEAGIVH